MIDLPENVFKSDDNRWVRYCPQCGNEISHLRRAYCINSHNIKQPCKRCSNKNNNPSGMCGYVRLSWYECFYKSALTRGYSWDLCPELINDLYEEQEQVCALSGLSIGWSKVGWDHTASIDRIDNDIGYTIDNIQLVHKQINMMRGSLSIPDFINLCDAVTNKIR